MKEPPEVPPVTPSACAQCNRDKRPHWFQHAYVPPGDALIKARMLARREARLAGGSRESARR